jgi:hypothetical protein
MPDTISFNFQVIPFKLELWRLNYRHRNIILDKRRHSRVAVISL